MGNIYAELNLQVKLIRVRRLPFRWENLDTTLSIGHVLNEQGTGYEHIFSWYECSISIELKMGHVI